MLSRRGREGWRSLGPALAAVVAGWTLATACSGSPSAPAGSGDDVVNDTRDAEVRAPANPDPGDDAGPDAPQGPVYGDDAATVYPGTAECGSCYCAPDKYFCFGGATVRDVQKFHGMKVPLASGDAGAKDAGLPACAVVSGTTPQLGCNALPSGCTDCACIINTLQASYSCTLECVSDTVGAPMTAYCANP